MFAKKNLKKGLVILLALLSVFTVAFSMSGCADVKGTYVNHDEYAYMVVNDNDVELYNVCVGPTHTISGNEVSGICLMTRATYTYSKNKASNGGYPIYVTVPIHLGTFVEDTTYTAYYFDESTPYIMYYRAPLNGSGPSEEVKFYKGTPNVQYNPLYL